MSQGKKIEIPPMGDGHRGIGVTEWYKNHHFRDLVKKGV